MLRELFALWRERGSAVARRLGLDREAVSIEARYRRCHEAWQPHLAATQRVLDEAAQACPAGGTALILGSGACFDVPLETLAERFGQVVLLDAQHPRRARRLAAALPNVRLVAADVTGMADAARAAGRGRGLLPDPVPRPDPLPGLRPDFTASVNLASQLPIPFYGLLGRKVPEAARQAFCRGLIRAHFEWLAGLPGRACLVCDSAWQRVRGERMLESRDALEGVALPPADRSWIWRIAPSPEESAAYDRQNRVVGFLDFASAWKRRRAAGPAGNA